MPAPDAHDDSSPLLAQWGTLLGGPFDLPILFGSCAFFGVWTWGFVASGQFGAAIFAVLGSAAAQSYVLRRFVRPSDWFGATAIADVLLIGGATYGFWWPTGAAPLVMSIFALLAAVLQWSVLRAASGRPDLWLALRLSIGPASYLSLLSMRAVPRAWSHWVFGLEMGLITGVSASIALCLCLSQPKPSRTLHGAKRDRTADLLNAMNAHA